MVLVQCEMQSVSPRIWTRVAVSISYDDDHYTTGTQLYGFKYYSSTLVHLLHLSQWGKILLPNESPG